MEPFTLALIGGSVAQGGISLLSAVAEARRRKIQGAYQKQQLDFNAEVSDWQGDLAIKRGAEEASEVRKAGNQTRGSQRAAAAAQGLDVDSGTMADLQAETERMTQDDMQTATNNAWLESWGMKMQSQQFRAAGRMAEMGAEADAKQTLINGGLQAAGALLKGADYARGGLSLGYQKKMAGEGGSVAGTPLDRTGRMGLKHPRPY